MRKSITQRELRNGSGKIMRALDGGQSFVVTRNGVPVGEIRPLPRREFVPAADVVAAFSPLRHDSMPDVSAGTSTR
ncbi:MAG TPA: PhdYeFM domain-containing protein [Vicinamibacteria bacterium]|jgi:antitoxin (DNA-binding transcriptional repressor) of toxin-antitoxin stability system